MYPSRIRKTNSIVRQFVLPAMIWLVAIAVVVTTSANIASAQSHHWINTSNVGNDFSVGSNWAEGSAPDSTLDAIFSETPIGSPGLTYEVVFSSDQFASNLDVDDNVTFVGGFTLNLGPSNASATASGNLTLDGTSIDAGTGSFAVDGSSLRIENGAILTSQQLNYSALAGGGITISGSGSAWIGTSLNTSNLFSIAIGDVVVENGGLLSQQGGTANIGGGADVFIQDPGSTWEAAEINITGLSGAGLLGVANGGHVQTSGSVTFNGSGGQIVDASSLMDVGTDLVLGTSGLGTMQVDGGTLQVGGSISMGTNGGIGSMQINDGTVQVGGGIVTGIAPLAFQTISVNGGSVTANSLEVNTNNIARFDGGSATFQTITNDGKIILDGGTLTTQSIVENAGSQFEFLSGVFNLNDVNALMTFDHDQAFSSTRQLNTSGRANVAANATVDITGNALTTDGMRNDGRINIVSGAVSLGSSNRHDGYFGSGRLDVNGNNVLLEDAGFAQLGVLTTIAGGQLDSTNGVSLGSGKCQDRELSDQSSRQVQHHRSTSTEERF